MREENKFVGKLVQLEGYWDRLDEVRKGVGGLKGSICKVEFWTITAIDRPLCLQSQEQQDGGRGRKFDTQEMQHWVGETQGNVVGILNGVYIKDQGSYNIKQSMSKGNHIVDVQDERVK